MSPSRSQQLGAAVGGLLPLVSWHSSAMQPCSQLYLQVPWHLCALWTANLSEQHFSASPQRERCVNSSSRAGTPPISLP